jgi:cytochrome P450
MAIRQEVNTILNMPTGVKGNEGQQSVFYELKDNPSLPESEKSAQRLEDEATLLVMAGTESTAKSLTMAHYAILANPKIMKRLRAELRSRPSASLAELEKLPYLNGIIQEAHRLTFGLTGRNARVCPDQTLKYTDKSSGKTYTFPPGTPLSASSLLVHTNEILFPDPWTFEPERWIGPDSVARRKSMLSFGRGPRICIGMHLANAEMCMAVAAMARWDMELFQTSDLDVTFLHDYHVAAAKLNSKGVCVKVLQQVA